MTTKEINFRNEILDEIVRILRREYVVYKRVNHK